jgi:hypothetical protein
MTEAQRCGTNCRSNAFFYRQFAVLSPLTDRQACLPLNSNTSLHEQGKIRICVGCLLAHCHSMPVGPQLQGR